MKNDMNQPGEISEADTGETVHNFAVDKLEAFAARILEATGVAIEEAGIVADELIKADLAGHASHGVMRLQQYVEFVEKGQIKPGVPLRLIAEHTGLAVYNGDFGFGQQIVRQLLEIAMPRARDIGTFTIFCGHCNHIGRLASYTIQAARQGFLTMMACNVTGAARVVPHGAREARLGTNPICIAAPYRTDVIVIDTTTSAISEGKVRIASQNNRPVPPGRLLDQDGRPTTDPRVLYDDPLGGILPLGGDVAFKGSGLAVMIDVVGGILSGSGFGRSDVATGTNGVWLYMVDLTKVMTTDTYDAAIEAYVHHLKSARPAAGVDEVLLPGEIERNLTARRRVEGIPIPDGTWRQLVQLAKRLNVSLPD